jgi:hypothetical protein
LVKRLFKGYDHRKNHSYDITMLHRGHHGRH